MKEIWVLAIILGLPFLQQGLVLAQSGRPVQAPELPAMVTFTTDQGQGLNNSVIEVRVWEGHTTAIDFSRTGEFITNIILADPSRLVFSTNAAVESGQAQSVFLRRITPLEFPLTTAQKTNIFVTTQNARGTSTLYTFDVIFLGGTPFYRGISIAHPQQEDGSQTLEVGYSRPATLSDIEQGLEVAIEETYASPNEPVVTRVKQFLALARNGVPIFEAAERAEVSIALLSELGRLGIEK